MQINKPIRYTIISFSLKTQLGSYGNSTSSPRLLFNYKKNTTHLEIYMYDILFDRKINEIQMVQRCETTRTLQRADRSARLDRLTQKMQMTRAVERNNSHPILTINRCSGVYDLRPGNEETREKRCFPAWGNISGWNRLIALTSRTCRQARWFKVETLFSGNAGLALLPEIR